MSSSRSERFVGLLVSAAAFAAGGDWLDKHPPTRSRPADLPGTLAWGVTHFGMITAFPGLAYRLRWENRLSRRGIARYVVLWTAFSVLWTGWAIRVGRGRAAESGVAGTTSD